MHAHEIDKPESEKELFCLDVTRRMESVLKSFAERRHIELAKLRFLYQGKILYADNDDTLAQLGIREGDVVHALVKEAKAPPTYLTPNAIQTIRQMSPDRLFEPVVQVTEVDMSKRKVSRIRQRMIINTYDMHKCLSTLLLFS